MKNDIYPLEIIEELDKVEKILIENIRSKNELIQKESEKLINAGGKRLRPALLILCSKFGEYDREKILSLAASIEMLHLATLVHDDVIDEAKVRRGVESTHDKHGDKVAVFTGDFLFAKTFLLISKYNDGKNLEYLARGVKNICEGEVEQFITRYDLNVSINKYLKRIKFKTALLFALSCQIGAEAAKCDKKTIKYLRNFGMALGTAFQIEDDILDFIGEKERVGKPVANDVKVGVYTLPIIYALNSSKYGDKLKTLLESNDDNTSEIINIVEKSGGLEYSREVYNRYLLKAMKWLNKLPDVPYKDYLIDLSEKIVGRKS